MNKPTQEMFNEHTEEDKQQEQEKVSISSDVVNLVDLPSNGQLGYPKSVEYREILVKDEEVLASATSDTYARTLNKVLKSVLNDCEFYENMTVHDRDFALVWVWANNYSPTKHVSFVCPKCKNESVHVVDFTKQQTTDINPKFKGYYEQYIKKLDTSVKVRLNTVADELIAEEYLAKNKTHSYEHLLLVQSIDFGFAGIPLEQKLRTVSENVTGAEMNKIKQFHIQLRYGLDSEVEYVCKNSECGEVTKDAFPFHTADILHPTVQTDIEEFL